ncbi:MAG: SOS response-associated peptidase [Verrucomicrobiota bacterium]
MCGRYTLTKADTALRGKLRLLRSPKMKARYNIAPGQPIAAVRAHETDATRELAIFNWGLVPFWAKEPSIGYKMLNARSETAADKPAFRGPMRHHRCLIPADGFFEWRGTRGTKQPYYFRRKDRQPFCFAALFDHWGSPDGSEIESMAILTTAANDFMAPIHDRMPVIIHEQDYDRWLDPTSQRPAEFKDLLVAPDNDYFVREPVTPLVNSTKNDSVECIEPTTEMPAPPSQMGFEF